MDVRAAKALLTTQGQRMGDGRTGRLYRSLLVAAIALPLLLTAAAISLSLHSAFREAEREVTRAAEGAAEYARRVLDGHRMAVDRVNDRLRGLSDDEILAHERELSAALRALVADTPQARTACVFDRHGRLLVGADTAPAGRRLDMNDQEFRALLGGEDAPRTVVTRVYQGRRDGKLSFTIARRRRETGNADLPSGAFDGQVNVSVDPEEVGAGLRALLGRPGDAVALVRADGEVLARSLGYRSGAPIHLDPNSPMRPGVEQGLERGLVTGPSGIDGVSRIAAFRRVAGWPVYVTAGRSRDAVLAGWTTTVLEQLAVGLPATALLGLLVMVVRRREAELAEANGTLEQHVADRTAALAESEARLRRVQRIGRVGGFEIDLRSGNNERSAEYMRLHGMAPAARIEGHADWVARLHPEDRARAERYFLQAIADDTGIIDYAQEYRIVTPGGQARWIAARAEVERDSQGRATRVVGAHLDITELKAAQAVAAEGAVRLRAALRGARFGVWERHLPTSSGSWDARATEIYGGLSPERTSPDLAEWRDRVHPDDRAARLATIEAAIAPGGPDNYDAEFRFRRDDGEYNWVVVHGCVVERDPVTSRGVRLAGVVQDVTERRAAEAALREGEAWLRMAQEAGRIGSWEVDPGSGRRRWSAGTYRIWGLPPEAPLSLDLLMQLIHPDDRSRVQEVVARARDQRCGRLADLGFRIYRASDGAERSLVSSGELMPGPDGRSWRQIGIMQDVTEQRAAEAALRASEERLRLAQDAGGVGSWEWTVATGDLYWSESCHRLHGTDPSSPASFETWRGGMHPEDVVGVTAALDDALRGDAKEWSTDFRVIRPSDRAIRWIAGRGTIERDATGRATRLRGIVLDITAQKEAEALQRFLVREIDHRAKNALAVVQATVRLTPKGDTAAYAQAIEGRVRALARAHTLLAQGRWAGADLLTLARGELAPFLVPAASEEVPVVSIAGPAVQVSAAAAQGLSMALHELATNATKYGALSVPTGRLSLTWSIDDATGVLTLRWEERGGPQVVSTPSRRGFGTRVLEGTIRTQLGGAVRCDWESAGLVCEMAVPLNLAIEAQAAK